jgi:RimJ/RimL family protein N-acetyltransferase
MPAPTDARTAHTPFLSSHDQQTYLVGEEVYLRPFAPADAEHVQAWKPTEFPISPDRVRAQLSEGEKPHEEGRGKAHLIVVRRADERPVGSVVIHFQWFPHIFVDVTIDPLYGADGARWKGEAAAMTMQFVVDEWQRPIASVSVGADETAAIEHLERIGARQMVRFAGLYSRRGARVDGLSYEYINAAWAARLGDPAERELPRSGTGQPRPVVAPVVPAGDPPANAVRVGPRVYLRPIQESDGRFIAHWVVRETDTNWSNGRYVFGAGHAWHSMKELQAKTPQEWVRFTVCLRESDEPIGFLGIADIDYLHRFAESESELLNPDYRGSGYGSEAKHLLFDYAFNTLGLHMLVSWVLFENTRSAAALRKQGYTEAGRVHWVTPREGTFTNAGTFQLHADAWRAMPRYPEGATRE